MKRARPPITMPHVPSFECSCGVIHNAPDAQLPVGWSRRGSKVWCADCTRAGIASRTIRPRSASAEKVRLRGQVIDLLQQGASLMPLGTTRRAEWVQQVNELLAQHRRAA